MYNCFISYSRVDSLNFVRRLTDTLVEKALRVWLDQHKATHTASSWQIANKAILRSDNFIFVVSPQAIQSASCQKEIEWAVLHNKRIIPVVHLEPSAEELQAQLHPAIAARTWISFAGEKISYDQAVRKLLLAMERDAEFVREHSQLSLKAQLWKENNKSADGLLFGAARSAAQAWLEQTHKNAPSPLEITDLQCEFITQSRWVAEHYRADAFIIAADEDSYWAKKVKHALLRAGKTVSDPFEQMPGIEAEKLSAYHICAACYIVVFGSANAQQSNYCQKEQQLAQQFNKPIIRLEIDKQKAQASFSGEIACLQLGSAPDETVFTQQIKALLNWLRFDEAYFGLHQQIAIAAHNWNGQQHNQTRLLQGVCLQQAKQWLLQADKRTTNGATDAQKSVIEASLAQQNTADYDVFVAFSELDYDFAYRLNEQLRAHAKFTWFEHKWLSKSDFREAIFRGVERANNVVCIITAEALHDLELRAQIGHAVKLKKRIIPLLFEKLEPASLPDYLAAYSPIRVAARYTGFGDGFGELIRILDTDKQHVQLHTRWLHQAIKWKEAGSNPQGLLGIDEALHADNWLQTAENKTPEATDLHKRYIAASMERRRRSLGRATLVRHTKIGLVVLLALGVGLALYAMLGAQHAQQEAQAESLRAQRLYQKANASNLVALARQLEDKNPTVAMRLAEKALELEESDAATKTVYDIYNNSFLYRTIGQHKRHINSLAYHPNTKLALTASDDKTAKIWSLTSGLQSSLVGHTASIRTACFSPKGNVVATGSADKTIRLWNTEGEIQKVLSGHEAGVNYIEFSNDGTQLLSAGDDHAIILWSVSGDMLKILTGHDQAVCKAVFAPQSNRIISCSKAGKIIIWNLQNESFQTINLGIPVHDLAVAPTGNRFAIACADGKIRIYDKNGAGVGQFVAHAAGVNSVAFSSSGKQIVSTSPDKTVAVHNRKGEILVRLLGHEQATLGACWGNNDQEILSIAADLKVNLWSIRNAGSEVVLRTQFPVLALKPMGQNQLLIWDTQGRKKLTQGKLNALGNFALNNYPAFLKIDDWQLREPLERALRQANASAILCKQAKLITGHADGRVQLASLYGEPRSFRAHASEITALAYDSASNKLLTGSAERSIKVWNNSVLDTTLSGHKGQISALCFASSTGFFASGSADGTIRLYDTHNTLHKVFIGHEGEIQHLNFSPSGRFFASSASDKTVRIWERDGYAIKTIRLNQAASCLVFNGDQELLVYAGKHLVAYPVPDALSTFQAANGYEQLTIAEMLDLKIKFYEELNTEDELYEGAKFYYQKANTQTDRTKQIRYLVYADNLFGSLHQRVPKALYYAEHLQVLFALKKFEQEQQASNTKITTALNLMLKAQDETDLHAAAQLLLVQGQQVERDSAARFNYKAAQMLFHKLHLQFGNSAYWVGSVRARLMLDHLAGLPLQAEKYTKELRQFTEQEIEHAAGLFFLQAEQCQNKRLRNKYLNVAEKLYDQLLQHHKHGDYFVSLTEVLLHLQEMDSSEQGLTTKLQNLSVQLFGLKNESTIRDAADRFFVKAERERSVHRKQTYLTNAETLYEKLKDKKLQVSHLIHKRKVLLELRRLSPQSNELANKIELNLREFAKLQQTKAVLVALNYFDRELAFTGDKNEKIRLLNLSLKLFLNLSRQKNGTVYLGKMHKVVLLLRQLQPQNPKLMQATLLVKQALLELKAENDILENIAMYNLWAKETQNKQLKTQYLEIQASLYLKLLEEKNTAKYLKRAWKLAQGLMQFDQQLGKEFEVRIWKRANALANEHEIEAWISFVRQQTLSADAGQRAQWENACSEILLMKKWNSKSLNQLAYANLCEQAQQQLVNNALELAKQKAQKAVALDQKPPLAYAIQGLVVLLEKGYPAASNYFQTKKGELYRGLSYRAFFLDYIAKLEINGFKHPDLARLKREALGQAD